MVIEHQSYHLLLNQTLEERGLNKNMLILLLEQYTRYLESRYDLNIGPVLWSGWTLEEVISEFIDSHPLTIDTILRGK